MFAFVNRAGIVPIEKAFLHVSDLSIQRGYGVFDFFKIQEGHALFLDDYLERFYASAQAMRLRVPTSPEQLTSIIHDLMHKNNLPESGIKIILTGGYSTDGYQPADPNLIITQQTLTLPGREVFEKGIYIITHEYIRDFPLVKTINYTMGIWVLEKMNEVGAADVLYYQNNSVSEFPRCNFFIVTTDNTIVTSAQGVLKGVTRKNTLHLSRKKYKVEERDVTLQEVLQAKEAFLTSTTKRIVPIVQINSSVIGNGKPGTVTLSLLQDLIDYEKEYIKQKESLNAHV